MLGRSRTGKARKGFHESNGGEVNGEFCLLVAVALAVASQRPASFVPTNKPAPAPARDNRSFGRQGKSRRKAILKPDEAVGPGMFRKCGKLESEFRRLIASIGTQEACIPDFAPSTNRRADGGIPTLWSGLRKRSAESSRFEIQYKDGIRDPASIRSADAPI